MTALKAIAKAALRGMGLVVALPYLIGYAVFGLILGRQRALTDASESIGKRAGLIGVYSRQAFYRCVLTGVGCDVHFGFMSLFSKPGAQVGDRVYIGRFCTLGYVHLEDDVMLADGVQVISGRHQHGQGSAEGHALRDNPQRFSKVTIGRGAWIGAGAVVMADVGPGAIVGAGAVVVKPVTERAKVGGVPAKPFS